MTEHRNRRADVLSAFANIVLSHGERAATLEAVAKQAGVSKGGLLYHFPSREALVSGLAEYFTELVHADLAAMRDDGGSVVEWYVHTSFDFEAPVEQVMAALLRLAPRHEEIVRPALRQGRSIWYSRILDEVGEPDIALAVLLIGDGVSYNTEVDGSAAEHSPLVTAASLTRLLRIVGATKQQETTTGTIDSGT